jgi:flagellar protein FlaG
MSSDIQHISSATTPGLPKHSGQMVASNGPVTAKPELPATPKLEVPKSPEIKFDPNKARENLSSVISMLNKQMESTQRGLGFSYDESKHTPVVKVTDTNSGEVVRQIPSEDVIKMARHIDQAKGMFFNNKA